MTPFQATQETNNRAMWLVVHLEGEPIEVEQVRFKRASPTTFQGERGRVCELVDGRRVPSARLHRSVQAARLDADTLIQARLTRLNVENLQHV